MRGFVDQTRETIRTMAESLDALQKKKADLLSAIADGNKKREEMMEACKQMERRLVDAEGKIKEHTAEQERREARG